MRALIVKTSSLGDVVHTFPVVEYLKSRQGVSHVGWVVEQAAAPLVRAHPLVDMVIEIDTAELRSHVFSLVMLRELRRQRSQIREHCWDCVFDLQGNIKSSFVTRWARSPSKVGYGRATAAEWPNIWATSMRYNPPAGLPIGEEYLYLVRQYFHDDEPFAASPLQLRLTAPQEHFLRMELSRWPVSTPVWFVTVGSAWPNKTCRTQTLLDVLRLCRNTYVPYFVFVAGTGEELREVGTIAQEFPRCSHVLYRPDLPLLQRMISHASAVLGVDSIILHLAATTTTPTLGLFGPSSAMKYAPQGQRHSFFQGSCPMNVAFDRRCPFLRTCRTGECLKAASPEDMFARIEAWQAEGETPSHSSTSLGN